VRPSPRPSWPLKKRSCLISADAGGVGYCTLTKTLFFDSGLGLGVWLMSDDDASFRYGSGVGHEWEDARVCPATNHGTLDGDPACRRPASGSGRLQSVSAQTAACVVMLLLLLLQEIASNGDGIRRAILEVVSPDITRLVALIREDGRGLGSIDVLRC